MVCIEFNARTSNLQDLSQTYIYVISISQTYLYLSKTFITASQLKPTHLEAMVQKLNIHGQQIIQLCKENNIRIVYGRCLKAWRNQPTLLAKHYCLFLCH